MNVFKYVVLTMIEAVEASAKLGGETEVRAYRGGSISKEQ